jgi:hypothetical protein
VLRWNGELRRRGRGMNGVQWPDGNYTIAVAGKDASGQTVSIPSEVQGVVDAIGLTKTPPVLAIGSQIFTWTRSSAWCGRISHLAQAERAAWPNRTPLGLTASENRGANICALAPRGRGHEGPTTNPNRVRGSLRKKCF